MSPRLPIAFALALTVSISLLVACGSLGIARVEPLAEPAPGPFTYALLAETLARHVKGAGVAYPELRRDDDALRRFVATLAAQGPETRPEAFPTEAARLAYYINAYNALVLLGVVDHYPIQSVQDVRGRLEPTAGFGFFYGLRFPLDGEWVHLYGLEHDVIRPFGDARIHAAINCASVSCPTLAAAPYLPETLDAHLDAAARGFASEPRHVHIDQGARQIRLSPIYDWFEGDFSAHATREGWGDGPLDFIAHFAEGDVAEALAQARAEGYAVVFPDYDWTLNEARPQGP